MSASPFVSMHPILSSLVEGRSLDEAQARAAFTNILAPERSESQSAAFLALIQARGPVVAELVGGATVMREHVSAVDVPAGLTIVDTCGTGGTHSRCFNISTSAAIVAAAAGREHQIAVAKHGNRSVTSASGSANVLDALGVKMPVSGITLTRCLDEVGLCFCFAPAHHPVMKYAGPIRQALGFRTIFNLLGPLTNPAGARRQLIGVPDERIADLMIQTLQRLGADRAMVITTGLPQGDGTKGAERRLGEMTPCAPIHARELHQNQITTSTLDPTSLGLSPCTPTDLEVDSPDASAVVIREVLAGNAGPARDTVILNAGAALLMADAAANLRDCMTMAEAAIDDGRAAATLEGLVRLTQADAT